MTKHGMGDEATIKEIISEVDTDNVSSPNLIKKTLLQIINVIANDS